MRESTDTPALRARFLAEQQAGLDALALTSKDPRKELREFVASLWCDQQLAPRGSSENGRSIASPVIVPRSAPRPSRSGSSARGVRLNIIGTGPMGLCTAYAVALLSRRFGLALEVRLIGARLFGSPRDQACACSRNQRIAHSGSLWAMTSPHTAMTVHAGFDRIASLAPFALEKIISLGLVPGPSKNGQAYLDACRALCGGGGFSLLARRTARRLWQYVPRTAASVLLTPDCRLDTSAFARQMFRLGREQGVHHIPQDVASLVSAGNELQGIELSDSSVIPLYEEDIVLLAAGARSLELAATGGVSFPARVRRYSSALVAAEPIGRDSPMLLTFFGGATMVPQRDGTLVFGNAARVEIDGPFLSEDDPRAKDLVRSVIDSARRDLGITPLVKKAWVATKTEISDGSKRCQDFGLLGADVPRCFFCLPGKMTSAIVAGEHVAMELLRPMLGIEGSVWGNQPALIAEAPRLMAA